MTAAPTLDQPASFDVEAVRAEFPVFDRRIHGRPLVYLDSAASAQKPHAVLDAMHTFAGRHYANVHRGLHTLANEATEAFEAARHDVAGFLGAGDGADIVLTAGATDGINLVAQGWAQANLKEGDEIVLSIMEHHSNIVPWHFLRERFGVVLRWVPVDEAGKLDWEAFEASLNERTKLVAMTHMSNVLGTLLPAEAITERAHAHGAAVLFDGCQSAVHTTVNVTDIGCDFYVISPHKLYGPTGIGALYIHPDRVGEMQPFRGGGEMIAEVTTDSVSYADPPHMFEAGTPAIVEAAGLSAAISWMRNHDLNALQAHEHAVMSHALDALIDLEWVRVFGPKTDRAGVIAFEVTDVHPHDIAQILDRYGVAVRAGHHCAQPLHKALGLPASLRVSFGAYNTHADVDAFLEALSKARSFFV